MLQNCIYATHGAVDRNHPVVFQSYRQTLGRASQSVVFELELLDLVFSYVSEKNISFLDFIFDSS